MNKLAEIQYKVAEDMLNHMDQILNQIHVINQRRVETFRLKSQKYGNNLVELIDFCRNELEQSEKYLDIPGATDYIIMLEVEDKETYLDSLRSELEAKPDEEIVFTSVAQLHASPLDLTIEEAEMRIEKEIGEKLIKEIKYTVITILADHMYCQELRELLTVLRQKIKQSVAPAATEESTNNSIAKNKQLESSQLVLAIMLLNEVNRINYSDADSNLINFICALTGRDRSNIKKFVEKAGNNDFVLHDSEQKTLHDFKEIRPLFEKLEHQEALAIIDKKIKKFNTLINNKL